MVVGDVVVDDDDVVVVVLSLLQPAPTTASSNAPANAKNVFMSGVHNADDEEHVARQRARV